MNNPMLCLQDTDFRLNTSPGSFPMVYIDITAVVSSLTADIDAVEMSAFKEKVRTFVESELPKHVKIREAAK